MAPKKNSESDVPVVVGVVPAGLIQMLDQGELGDSLETMKHHRVLNRLAVVQAQSKREVKSKFPPGTVFIPAIETKVIDHGGMFKVVPVMFFDEFLVWNDRDDKASPMIQESSLDISSAIAIRAGDPNRRNEKYGQKDNGKDQYERRYTHHLNFVVIIYDGELKGTTAVMSFSRGEFRHGMQWIAKIKARRISGKNSAGVTVSAPAPLWSTCWEIRVGDRGNAKGEWMGFDAEPAENPFVDNEDLMNFKAIHEQLQKEHQDRLLKVGHEAAETATQGEDFASAKDM